MMYRIEYQPALSIKWTRLKQRYANEAEAIRQAEHFRRAHPIVDVRVVPE